MKRIDPSRLPVTAPKKARHLVPFGEVEDGDVRDVLLVFRITLGVAILMTVIFLGWYGFLLAQKSIYYTIFNLPFLIFYALRLMLLVVVIYNVTNPLRMGIVGTYDRWRAVASFDPFLEGKMYCSLCFSTSVVGAFFLLLQLGVYGFHSPEDKHQRLWIAIMVVNIVAVILSWSEPVYILSFSVWQPLRKFMRIKEAELIRKATASSLPARLSTQKSLLMTEVPYTESGEMRGHAPPLDLSSRGASNVWARAPRRAPPLQAPPSTPAFRFKNSGLH